ncbi:nucleotidyltransferase family protein [Polaromonas sp. YR568]|uniref:nucleotidyltransferase family protein n=1 Tax=Polaromonas sp. YR568 TaxID=1855301 RepID=UPI003137C2ED
MTAPALPLVLVLAAGRGERFIASGGTTHKLDALLQGQPVRAHVLDAVRASGLSYHVVEPGPDRAGMGDSIAAGVRATADAPGWLILPADLPLLRSETLRRIAQGAGKGEAVTVPVYCGQRGHPVRFAAQCGPALMALNGNEGAASVVRTQAALGAVALLEVDDAGTVTDIDTLDDLRRAEALLRGRT